MWASVESHIEIKYVEGFILWNVFWHKCVIFKDHPILS